MDRRLSTSFEPNGGVSVLGRYMDIRGNIFARAPLQTSKTRPLLTGSSVYADGDGEPSREISPGAP
ncbi:hypothetical protein FHS92_002492 [Sphingobium subterraneum]|uniref:Uncharacterized protein n=1 Tax=Sphingobium subterraneum TaxID=627688 RepID=A0A841J0K3_9SPHN|nr:hypothetical protein [Sphingobium subterraneum]